MLAFPSSQVRLRETVLGKQFCHALPFAGRGYIRPAQKGVGLALERENPSRALGQFRNAGGGQPDHPARVRVEDVAVSHRNAAEFYRAAGVAKPQMTVVDGFHAAVSREGTVINPFTSRTPPSVTTPTQPAPCSVLAMPSPSAHS